MDFSLIVTCYNEADLLKESVGKVIKVLKEIPMKWEIVFVDDCSTDGTKEIIDNIIKNNSSLNFKKYFHSENVGRGKSVSDGIKLAEGGIAGFIDIDLEVSSYYLFPMIQKMKEDDLDIVVAKRIYQIGSGAIIRFITGACWRKLVKNSLQLPIGDTNSGCKIFRREKILPILDKTKDERWFWDTEIIARAYLAGLKIGEMPAVFIRRTDKKSAIKLFQDSIGYFVKLLRFKKEYKKALLEKATSM